MIRPQQYRLKFPWTASQVENADTMFETLFRAVQKLDAAVSFPTTVGTVTRTENATAALASVVTYTPSVDESLTVSGNVLVTTSTGHNFTMTCTYTDESSTPRTMTLRFTQVNGTVVTAVTNGTGVGPYAGLPSHIRVKAGTAVTLQTVGTFTTVVYNVEGRLVKLA